MVSTQERAYLRGLNNILADVWRDLERDRNQRERERAEADPAAHRNSRVMEKAGYRYFSTKNGRGSIVRFCYSTNRNVAGYFIVWREIETKKSIRRDQWDSAKTKADAIWVCKQRYQAATRNA